MTHRNSFNSFLLNTDKPVDSSGETRAPRRGPNEKTTAVFANIYRNREKYTVQAMGKVFAKTMEAKR